MNQKMRGHQLFNLITKISEKVLTPFLRSLLCPLLPSLVATKGCLLSINPLYVVTKINILQIFDYQFTIQNVPKGFDFLRIDFALKNRGVNKYQFTTGKRADSEDYSLFLPASPPLNRKRFFCSLFLSTEEVGNNCISTHHEIPG